MNKSRIYFQSMTEAQRAKDILMRKNIKSELCKKSSFEGCVWGIEYDNTLEREVRRILGRV